MRTTLTIDDDLLRRAKIAAAESGRTLGQVFEDSLRIALRSHPGPRKPLVALPTFGGSGVQFGVDLASSAALRDRMDEDGAVDTRR